MQHTSSSTTDSINPETRNIQIQNRTDRYKDISHSFVPKKSQFLRLDPTKYSISNCPLYGIAEHNIDQLFSCTHTHKTTGDLKGLETVKVDK